MISLVKKLISTLIIVLIVVSVFTSCKNRSDVDQFIWIIRNAENDSLGNLNQDGLIRSMYLDSLFMNENIDGLYSLNQKENIETLKYVSERKKIEIIPLKTEQLDSIMAFIGSNKRVVLCLNKDQIIPTINQIGLTTTIDSISKNQFEYLFKIILPASSSKEKKLEIRYF
jgi:hypothetical protein